MLLKELLEILEELSEEELEQELTIASEIIGESKDINYDAKTKTLIAYE